MLDKYVDAAGKKIVHSKIVTSETGIHVSLIESLLFYVTKPSCQSLEWASTIKTQKSSFVSLPVEVRNQIYGYIFTGFTITNPTKCGPKFELAKDAEVTNIKLYNAFVTACRQIYVDVVGGGLLYAISTFAFNTPEALMKYLGCINPAHLALIKSVDVSMTLSESITRLPTDLLAFLGSMSSLEELLLTFRVSKGACALQGQSHMVHHGLVVTLPRYWCVSAYVLSRLGAATWGDLQGIKNFEIKFVKHGDFDFSATHYGQVAFDEKITDIVTRKA